MGQVIILSAPSGSGKSTIANRLLTLYLTLEFSVSATSRQPRGDEQEGREYYFFSAEEFRRRIEAGDFLEWEEVYTGTYYGTLRSEIERIWSKGNIAVFDIDVVGGVNMKRLFGEAALSLFIMPPSIDELRKRLITRATDSAEAIERRLAKASTEIEFAPKFDTTIVNDNLTEAMQQTELAIANFIAPNSGLD